MAKIYTREEMLESLKKKTAKATTPSSNTAPQVMTRDEIIASLRKGAGAGTQEESGWFQKGDLFADGWQFGDVTRTVVSSAGDLLGDVGAGLAELPEKALDALIAIAPYVTAGQYYANGGGYNLQADAAFKQQNDSAKQIASKIVAKDLYDGQVVGDFITEAVGGTDAELNSVFGDKSDALAQSAGQLAGTALLQAAGVPAWLTIGLTSYGSEMENALNQGAAYEEAGLSALITAGAEVLTEQISGGINFSKLGTLDDAATKALARGISNKILRTGLKLGLDMAGEGAEEVASGLISALGQKLTYMSEAEWKELFSSEEVWESFVGGAVLGGIGGSVQAVQSAKQGKDYTSGLTKNEQAVVDKVYKDAVAQEEKNGKVTQNRKAEIYNEVLENMDKGYISTDIIEEVLGGETYKTYKDTMDSESALQKEYDELGDLVESQMTAKQKKRFNELGQQLADTQKNSSRNQLKTQLSQKVSDMVKSDRLSESYNEQGRKSQKFEADLTQYTPAQRKIVQKAIDSGILNNTNRSHEFVDLVAKIAADKNLDFDFADNAKLKETGFALDGVTVNGFVNKNGVTVNLNSAKALNSVVGHEVTHVLEGTELYDALKQTVTEYAKGKGEYETRLKQLTELYKGKEGYTGEDANVKIEKEVAADLIGDYLFADKEFVSSLSAQNRDIFDKIFDEVKYLCKTVTAGSKEARQLLKVKKAFEEAYRAETKNPTAEGGVKYSLGNITDANGKNYGIGVHLDSTLLDNLTPSERVGMVKEYVKELGGESFTAYDPNGNAVDITIAKSNAKFKNQNGKRVAATKDLTNKRINNEVKQEAIALIDELITTAEYDTSSTARYPHGWLDNNGKNDWEYWTTYIQDKNGTIWEATLNVANSANGEKILYDISPIKKVGRAIKLAALPTSSSIPQGKPTVNNKNSLSTEDQVDNPFPLPWNIKGGDVTLEFPLPEGYEAQSRNTAQQNEFPLPPGYEEQSGVAVDEALETAREEEQPTKDLAPTQGAQELVGDKDAFISQKATELYEEIAGLKKGVRASKRLGYLLDHGYDWRSIKTALLNIRDNPNEVVNPNSAAESVAREMLSWEYEDMLYDLSQQDEVTNSYTAKLRNLQTELANNQRLREDAKADYDSEIARLQSEYDGKRSKTTKAANNILRRMERLTRMKNTVDSDYAKRISDLEARIAKMDTVEYRRAEQRRTKQQEYSDEMEALIGDTSTWVDKKLGLSYQVNTLRRNLRDVVRDAEGNRDIAKADAIYDALQGSYNRHEAELNREATRIKQPYADMKITKQEDAYIQMLGELRHNPDTKLTTEEVDEYYEKHKKHIDKTKVDKAIEQARQTYDDLLARVNEALKEQGMKEIPYRQGYFPHFTEDKQSLLAKLLNWKTNNNEIPTDIAGLTEQFNPNRSWQSFNKQRKSDTTDYSFQKGLDSYVQGALDWVYHIEDIQRRRALENHIRYVHSEKGVQEKIDAIRANTEYDADEAQEQIDAAWKEAGNPLNNFVTDLRTGTNTLAGKKSSMDRGMEAATNRKVYSVMTNLSNRVSANMVGGSISSALTNFIPITQSWGEVSPISSLRAMGDTIRATFRDDGIVNKSDFLTNRLRKADNLYKGIWDKISDKVGFMMEAVDSFTSQTVWRSKYLENINAGMSDVEAIKNADQFAENVMAGRSRGNMPTIFESKNPVTKVLTAFQLEVANQYGYMLKDMPQDMRNEATGKLVMGYAKMFFGAYAYNALYSSLTGRDAAFDPVGIIQDLLRDLGLFGDDEEEEPVDAVLNLTENILEEVPFVGGLLGGGRIPISSALPYDGNIQDIIAGVGKLAEGDTSDLTTEWLNPVYYLALPMGGGQIRKTTQGMSMYSDEFPLPGSYTAGGDLRFPVPEDFLSKVQAGVFGQWASENAQQYIDEGRSPLSEKQVQEFMDVGMSIRDYWAYRDGLAELNRQSETGTASLNEKGDYIASLDLTVEQKNILINNIAGREEPIDMSTYGDYPNFEEFDFGTQNPGKYALSKAVGGYDSYKTYRAELGEIKSDKDENGDTVSGSRKDKVIDYINGLDAEYGEKIILYVSEYDSKESRDTYGFEIIDYLNSRSDISYSQMEAILIELGFKVDASGNVTWD